MLSSIFNFWILMLVSVYFLAKRKYILHISIAFGDIVFFALLYKLEILIINILALRGLGLQFT